LNNVNRRQFRGVMFRPGASPEVNNCLNLWQGWGVEDWAGDWGFLRSHILRVICNGNRDFAVYVIRWIAWAIQHPDAQAEVALVLIGQKGTGKGTLVRCLERIFKPHSFQVSDREDVIGKFNGHLEDVILFMADEAYWGGDKRCIGRLQGMITEPELPIQHKGFNTKKVPNYLHVVMLAEPGWVVPAGKHERRYAVLSVSDKHIGDVEYFTALRNEIANGGAEECSTTFEGSTSVTGILGKFRRPCSTAQLYRDSNRRRYPRRKNTMQCCCTRPNFPGLEFQKSRTAQ
jgi:hypothetical protein